MYPDDSKSNVGAIYAIGDWTRRYKVEEDNEQKLKGNMFNHQPRNIGSLAAITPAVKFLLILNTAIYFIDSFTNPEPQFRFLVNLFSLPSHWWLHYDVGQLFTYMFVHGSVPHLVMNMLGLYFIGPTVERTIGAYRFFILYYLSGIIGGLGWSLLAGPHEICLGASGAVMGILGAFGALYPNAEVLLIIFPFFPIKAWKLVLAFIGLEFFQTFVHPIYGGIANAAHLMGGIAGCSYALALKHPHFLHDLKHRLSGDHSRSKSRAKRNSSNGDTLSREEVDRILDKIGKEGMGALTPRERELLKRATR